jgi:hypothetical protein
MAITYSDDHWKKELRGTTQYEGQVLGRYSQSERVMSDVWEDISYALVWDIEKSEPKHIPVGMSGTKSTTTVTIDAPDDLYEVYEAYEKFVQAQRALRELNNHASDRRERAEKSWHTVEKGKVMVVVRGRKVPKSTVGRVFWVDDYRNPYRVGLALTDEVGDDGKFKDVAFVNADYLKNAEEYPGYKVIADNEKAEKIAWLEKDVAKGDQDAAEVLKRIKERDRDRQKVGRSYGYCY